jgi:hypothetical protein
MYCLSLSFSLCALVWLQSLCSFVFPRFHVRVLLLLFFVVNNNYYSLFFYFYSNYWRVISFSSCLVQINLTNVTTTPSLYHTLPLFFIHYLYHSTLQPLAWIVHRRITIIYLCFCSDDISLSRTMDSIRSHCILFISLFVNDLYKDVYSYVHTIIRILFYFFNTLQSCNHRCSL